MALRLWFTRGLSNTVDALALIRQGESRVTGLEGRLHLLASHTDPANAVLQEADTAFLEP